MSFSLVRYQDHMLSEWDDFIQLSKNATFLCSQKFLSYHGKRFTDVSYLVYDDKKDLIAVFPCALSEIDSSVAISHPGSSYGGLILRESILPALTLEIFQSIINEFSSLGIKQLIYKCIPKIYKDFPNDLEQYIFFLKNGIISRVDLSSCINLRENYFYSSRRMRGIKKANKSKLTYSDSFEKIDSAWHVLKDNLRKFDQKPVHSEDEIKLLQSFFPDKISLHTLINEENEILAGILLFTDNHVAHSQYIFSSSEGRTLGALDYLFDIVIRGSKAKDLNYFSFGISTEDGGKFLNQGLYNFKSEFGSRPLSHDFWTINCC